MILMKKVYFDYSSLQPQPILCTCAESTSDCSACGTFFESIQLSVYISEVLYAID
jgi:hypothetical protein